MIQQLHAWVFIQRKQKPNSKRYMCLSCSMQHYLQQPRHWNNMCPSIDEWIWKCGIHLKCGFLNVPTWELDHKESWAPKNWCFWSVVLQKTLESPLDCKEIQPVHPKGNQSWPFIGRTDTEAEAPILWPPDAKSQLTGKDPDAGKDWRQEEKGTTEDEMVGWQHRLDGCEFGWTPGVVDGQGGLACCDSWSRKESDMTEQLNWTELDSYTSKTSIILNKNSMV